MNISDLKSSKGLNELNNYLQDRTYITGYTPTQDDIIVFNKITKPPGLNTPHLLRWYDHIKSHSSEEIKEFPAGSGSFVNAPSAGSATANGKTQDDDDVDLFASDEEEDKEAKRIREERLKSYNEKKAKKPTVVAKSSIILDVKPWDDETNMSEMEKKVRNIAMDGLVWGASKLVPVGFGIKKLQIMCVVEDDKVSVDDLVEQIHSFEDLVQSVDIAAFNKI